MPVNNAQPQGSGKRELLLFECGASWLWLLAGPSTTPLSDAQIEALRQAFGARW
jgi:hypothetical protein